uniref:Signal transduction histidine-protein kinase/phosphatase MprB n=1 Tax=uncultured Verrucomicrobiota bacterium TaxID=156588 RepID=D2DXW6_9BACT|nr:integral membrane sensor signal transduction histidine kinase [uncultured Verrucomicrobiota bacterium]
MKSRSLTFRLAAAFLAFVVVGTLALAFWLSAEEVRQSRAQFVEMARTNAEFLRTQHLPPTERTAQSLQEVLRVKVYCWRGPAANEMFRTEGSRALSNAVLDPTPTLRVEVFEEAIHFEYEPEKHVAFERKSPAPTILNNTRTLAMLATFWLLSLALAMALARSIVRPLRELANRLPTIAEEHAEAAFPETMRGDEIGDLARAYADTRAQLVAERRARQQAEQLATLGRMATGLAHEINNPISAIKLHTQLLEFAGTAEAAALRTADETEREQRLKIILDESAKIEGLVSQWMFLARPQPPQTAPCDLADLVAQTVQSQRPAADHAKVRLVNETTPGLLVPADRRRLAQAMANVVINAIHAMAADSGTLTISAVVAQGSTICLRFTDTGPGFSEAALARATELLFSEKEGGMGIGLNVSAEILRAHGGELVIANGAAGGAVITFVLPASEFKKP